MCKKVLLLFVLLISSLITASAEETKYYSPALYKRLWLDFCFEHLLNNPEDCSEKYIDREGNFYVTFSKSEDAEAFIDIELVRKVSHLSHLIPKSKRTYCGFHFCEDCLCPVAHTVFAVYDEEEEEENWYGELYSRCKCKNEWFEDGDLLGGWEGCERDPIPSFYFDIYTKQFFPFFEQHLHYCAENSDCSCYWPYRSQLACKISDIIYKGFYPLVKAKSSCLSQLRDIRSNSTHFPYLKNRAPHGVLTGLFAHAFFYTQYRKILLSVAQWVESTQTPFSQSIKDLENLHSLIDAIQPSFLELYSTCLQKHPHPKIFYERGMIFFHQGKSFDSLSDIRKLIDWEEENHLDQLLTSDLYLQEGVGYAETGLYDKAIEELSKAIQKDPKNKEAYFERASAYFEKGNLEESLQDFLSSGIKSTPIDYSLKEEIKFAAGLIMGGIVGTRKTLTDFLPSMLCSLQGLGHALWSLALDPKEVSKELVTACRNMIDFLSHHTSAEILKTVIPELGELIDKGDKLNDYQKGELIGIVLGRYGTDFLLFAGVSKGIRAFRDLKRANEVLTLEKMTTSLAQKKAMEEFSKKWWLETSKYIKRMKGKGGKIDRELYKAFRNQKLSEHQVRKILHTAGYETFPRPKGIPSNWDVNITKKNGGMKYINSANLNEHVRVMPGNPDSPNLAQKRPYVIHMKNDKAIDKFGYRVTPDSVEAHIPLSEFEFKEW